MLREVEKHWSRPGVEPSPTERIIINALTKNKIKFMREVCFQSCRNSRTGAHLRFDFYLHEMNILLEYDGKEYHIGDNVQDRDAVKDKYAKDFGIKLIRISGIRNIHVAIEKIIELRKKRNLRKLVNRQWIDKKPEEPKKIKPVKTQAEIREAMQRSREFINNDPEPCKGVALPKRYKKLPEPAKKSA